MRHTTTGRWGGLALACLLLAGPLAGASLAADFLLTGSEQLTVDTDLGLGSTGDLYDQSQATIVAGGDVSHLNAYGTSIADVSGGTVGWLEAYNTSTARGSSGHVSYLEPHDTSTANVYAGWVGFLKPYGSGTANVYGGTASQTLTYEASVTHFFGGSLAFLYANDTSTVIFHGRDFQFGNGLSLSGNQVLGTGVLSGKWLDNTSWSVNIFAHDAGATVYTPEPATLSLLVLGGAAVVARRRAARR